MRTKDLSILCMLGLIAAGHTIVFAGTSESTVTVNSTATVNNDYIMLGDIATITPSPLNSPESAKVASTIIGRSPLPGQSRPMTRGDIILHLRANDIDPQTVDLEGAADLTVSRIGAGPVVTVPGQPGVQGQQAQAQVANPNVIKFGDEVDLMVIDGPVIVQAKAYATQSGAVGDTISVRRDGVDHLLQATVIAEGQCQLEE